MLKIMDRLKRSFKSIAWLQIVLYILAVTLASFPAPVMAATPVAAPSVVSPSVATPVVAAPVSASVVSGATGSAIASDLSSIQHEITVLKGQIGTLNTNINSVNAAAKPLIQTGKTISGQVNSFPDKVTTFRQKYGIPVNNPSLDDEWAGIQKYLLRKAGMSPGQADIMAAKMAKTPVMEHLKQPFKPTSIATAVGITAGLNILKQVKNGEKLSLVDAMSFVKEKTFWGGMMASGIGYALSSYVAMSLLPPGVGVVAALVPTFAGMLGSALGWEIGSADGKPIGDVFKDLDFAQMVGQAAGSSLGVVLGGQLAMVMFAGLGTIAGPLGAIAGALILGPVGARIAGFVRDFIMGDTEALKKAGAEVSTLLKTTDKVIGTLEDHGYIPPVAAIADLPSSPGTSELKGKYSELYTEFLKAHNENRSLESLIILKDLREVKDALDAKVTSELAQ